MALARFTHYLLLYYLLLYLALMDFLLLPKLLAQLVRRPPMLWTIRFERDVCEMMHRFSVLFKSIRPRFLVSR